MGTVTAWKKRGIAREEVMPYSVLLSRPVSAWLELDPAALDGVNKCAASCCGDEGILVRKFEREAGLLTKPE